MKNNLKSIRFLLITLYFISSLCFVIFGQAPIVSWDKTIGGNDFDILTSCEIQSLTGEIILAGHSTSTISGDKAQGVYHIGNGQSNPDFWVVKLNANREIMWSKVLGGYGSDTKPKIKILNDGSLIIAGTSSSFAGGDKTEDPQFPYGSDFWIIKLNSNGDKIWDKTIGTGNDENLASIEIDNVNNIYLLGNSYISGNYDLYLIKLNENGQKIWAKNFGGLSEEGAASINIFTNGNLLISGYSCSLSSVTKTASKKGECDYWIIKLTSNGEIIWDKSFGGANYNLCLSSIILSNGNFILNGVSNSNLSIDKSHNSFGDFDIWVIMLDSNGNKIWDKTFGGSNQEWNPLAFGKNLESITVACRSSSSMSGNKTEVSKGGTDIWTFKVDFNGNKIWDKTIGGEGFEDLVSINSLPNDKFVLGCQSNSNISGDKTQNSKGFLDYWLVGLSNDPIVLKVSIENQSRPQGTPLKVNFKATSN